MHETSGCVHVKVSVQVDDDLQKTGTTVGEFTMLSSKLMFVGGRPRTTSVEQLTPATNHNFKGCFKQVCFLPSSNSSDKDSASIWETLTAYYTLFGGVVD